MTIFPPIGPSQHDLISFLQFEKFDVSWAGASLRKDLFCFGSDDGRILFADVNGTVQPQPQRVTVSEEAINGVAFVQRWLMVSTRNELMLWTLPVKNGEKLMGAPFPIGAHGVLAARSGKFFAPLGREGVMVCRPDAGREQAVSISTGAMDDAYFYRMAIVEPFMGQEVIAVALRRGGVAAMEFNGEDEQHKLSALTFDGLDVVDICPLNVEAAPGGAVAVGRDGTLILFRDVLKDSEPGTVKYESIKGDVYRLLSAQGYLFILTTEGLYVIAGLIDRFLNGAANNPVTPVLTVPMEAVEANLGNDQIVWIVMPDGVLRFDVEVLKQITPTNLTHGEMKQETPTRKKPTWHRNELNQQSTLVPAGT
ncbi:MAG: hypothetical protein K2R98_25490 [Gemmataceae bacterium]|nr:hypothetical protein [Gemmataceae bacterium]